MDTHNISVCVAPSIFHKSDRQTLVDVESSFQTIAFVKNLIENCQQIFGEDTITLLNASTIQTIQDKKIKEDILLDNDNENEIDKVTPVTELMTQSDSTKLPPTQVQISTMKQNSTLQKREFGRMLNLVSLKGRKSLAPKIAAKAKVVSSSSSSLSADLTAPAIKMLSSSASSTSSYSSTTSIQHQFNEQSNKLNDVKQNVSNGPQSNLVSFSKNTKNTTNNSNNIESKNFNQGKMLFLI